MNSPESRVKDKPVRGEKKTMPDCHLIPWEGSHAILSDVGGGKVPKRFLIKRQEKGNRLFGKECDGLTTRITNGPGGTPCEKLNKQRDPIPRWYP